MNSIEIRFYKVPWQIIGVRDDGWDHGTGNDCGYQERYCPASMILCVNPKRAEMLPKVRPVDMSSVVYIPSVAGLPKYRVAG